MGPYPGWMFLDDDSDLDGFKQLPAALEANVNRSLSALEESRSAVRLKTTSEVFNNLVEKCRAASFYQIR